MRLKRRTSYKAETFTESVIREMTRRVIDKHGANGINLAQGYPDFPAPREIKDAACRAIQEDINQYAITWGARNFREAIAQKTKKFLGVDVDPETEITVCCGATEGMISALMATLNPDDEVIIFSPFYENYGPDCILSGAQPKYISLNPPDWSFDRDELVSLFGPRTRGIIINTPHNPLGKVYSRDELEFIAALCQEHDVLVFTDEIYEHIVYDDSEHISMMTIEGMRDRTIVVNGLSKTYSVTGWRVGYVIAPPDITLAIRKVHDFLTVGAAAPLQEAGVVAMQMPDEYYIKMRQEYQERRDLLYQGLVDIGFVAYKPKGAYYIMAEIEKFGLGDDVEFANHLIDDYGVAVVPGSSFYHNPELGRGLVRFAFPKRIETIAKAVERLSPLGKLL